MEKINIAELLKDCPKGMELDCTMIDNVVFEKLDFISSHHPIIIRRTDSNKTIHLTKYGQYSDEEDYKCVIFPKGKTTWEGFVPPCEFKDGDIITNPLGTCIFKGEGKIKGTVDYYCGISSDSDCFSVKDNKCRPYGHYGNIVGYRLATEKEKEKLFQAIKENGYNWNPETKTFEKLQLYKEESMEEKLMPRIDLTGYCKDKYIIDLRSYEIKEEKGVIYAVRKQSEYPNTYEECCKVLGYEPDRQTVTGYDAELIENLQTLKLCRDAYWTTAGDWKPEFRFGKKKYCIMTKDNKVIRATVEETNRILVFPTEEMRDAFYENFKDLIESCKELL